MLTGMQSCAGTIVKLACGFVVQEYVHGGFAVGYRNLSCEYIFVDEAGDIALPRSPWFADFHLIQSTVTVPPYAVLSCFAAGGNCKVCIEYR
jgi:hypothetical protein